VTAVDLTEGRIEIKNKQYFSDLSGFRGVWEVLVEGEVVQQGDLPPLRTPPGESEIARIPLTEPALPPGAECLLTVRFLLATDTPWAEQGHEVAWEQFKLPFIAPASAPQPLAEMPDLGLAESVDSVRLTGPDFAVTFDLVLGELTGLTYRGATVLQQGPRLNAWRAPTDNDGFKFEPEREDKLLGQWLKAGLNRLERQVERVEIERLAPQAVRLTFWTIVQAPGATAGLTHRHTYTIHGNGEVVIDNLIEADPGLPPLPRLGLTMTLPGGFEQFTWYGRGPHESYIWLSLTNAEGAGLLAVGSQPLEASVSHFSADDLYAARHTNELTPRAEVILNLDVQQSGLGGASCGPETLPQYLVAPGRYAFRVRLRPVTKPLPET
jgi:beta-galactosidase/beta-glucuronidase